MPEQAELGANVISEMIQPLDIGVNSYLTIVDNVTTTGSGFVAVSGSAGAGGSYLYTYGDTHQLVGFNIQKGAISPILYFKYIKSKFKLIERIKMDARLDRIQSAYKKAISNGQDALAKKIIAKIAVQLRESAMYAKGVTKYIEREHLNKHKRNIRDGHISDTKFKEFTRIIPEDVLKRKKEVEDVFDDFVIYHYWNENQDDVKHMSPDEKAKMRDPVLFGIVRETDRLYFIADWEDEYCDLTFDELVDVVGKEEITKNVEL